MMVSYEKAELLIKEYINNLDEPKISWKRDEFSQASYSRWAAKEVLMYIQNSCEENPLEAIEFFTYKMDQLSLEHPQASYIFSVAYDIAMDIYAQLLAYPFD